MIEQRRASHAERILSSHVPEPIVSRPPEPELVAVQMVAIRSAERVA